MVPLDLASVSAHTCLVCLRYSLSGW
jgi:hypothetical protein